MENKPGFDITKLINAALKARENAYVPYSNFRVGAALLTDKGKVFTGCNIENMAFSPTNCAERTAFFKAVSEGERKFTAIAVVGGEHNREKEYCPPCGVCRQVMMEFCDPETFFVILANSETDYKILTLKELLPYSFNKDFL